MQEVYISNPSILCGNFHNTEELWNGITEGNQNNIKKTKTINGLELYASKINKDILPQETQSEYDSTIIRMEEYTLSKIDSNIKSLIEKYGKNRIGVCIGSCDNGSELCIKGHEAFFNKGAFPDNYDIKKQAAEGVSRYISDKYDLTGPSLTFSTACSSSSSSIIKACQLIKSGICDAVITGGIDMASDFAMEGFNCLEAISPFPTNPLSLNRHGITIGEASVIFILTKDDLYNTNIVIKGYGQSTDAYHMTSPDPSGEGAYKAMKEALVNANLKAQDIGYLNLHGTGTKLNDSMETLAISKLFSQELPISSTKPITGHTLGAAGALEVVICYMVLKENKNKEEALLPIHKWDGVVDNNLPPLNIVSKSKHYAPPRNAMSNTFAFGGANCSIILALNK